MRYHGVPQVLEGLIGMDSIQIYPGRIDSFEDDSNGYFPILIDPTSDDSIGNDPV
jgi:hypothetical protein